MEHDAPLTNKLRILSIGSNATSAFFSWRLQASQAADVTIVWRSHFETVAQYGISFRSDVYGPARFKPNRVVRTVDEAASSEAGFDYVFVCLKALPDIYKLGDVIRPVITPSHTCIIVNTTMAIGIERELLEMYPRNMVLSLCSGVEITQTGPADFDHTAMFPVYVGAIKENTTLPQEAQQDMTESLTLTLEAGAVQCVTTPNIEKHQWERLIGPIAFHPISIILKEPNHAKLMEEIPIAQLINDLIDECLRIAEHRGAAFPFDFKSRVLTQNSTTKEAKSPMYQDFLAGRPLEIGVFLVTPLKFAEEASVPAPSLRSVYSMLNHLNIVNQQKPPSPLPQLNGRLAPQLTGQSFIGNSRPHMARGATDGAINGGRAMSMVYGPPPVSGSQRGLNVQSRRQAAPVARQDSLEGLEEFADVAMYNDLITAAEGQQFSPRNPGEMQNGSESASTRHRANWTTQPRASTAQGCYAPSHQTSQRPPPRQGAFAAVGQKMSALRLSSRGKAKDFEDDDDDDYADAPMPRTQLANPDQFDMMAMTRRGRNSAMSFRTDTNNSTFGAGRGKSKQTKSQAQAQALMNDIPGIHDTVTNTALFGMGDNRYGTVDSRSLAKTANSRLNSMQSERLNSISSIQPGFANSNLSASRPAGPPNSMNGRGPYPANAVNYRGPQQYGGSAQSLRLGLPQQAALRQHRQANEGLFPTKAQENLLQGTRSVTGSASASFGSLGNGSGSHSSSSSRDDLPPLPK